MLCMTLTLAKPFVADQAKETIDQLVVSLNKHPNAIGGEITRFRECHTRKVQGFLASTDETVGFILSAARSGAWFVHLTIVPDSQAPLFNSQSANSAASDVLRQAQVQAKSALRAPGGIRVAAVQGQGIVGMKEESALGSIESGLQLLCAIERRRTDEGQEAGLLINAGSSQAQAARQLEVSQQAVSSRLQAGYWYESRRAAYWLARQIQEFIQRK